MSTPQAPKLTVQLSLSPTTYSYSNPIPPTLSLSVTSDAKRPITLLTYNTPFHPAFGLTQDCFPIWDLTTDSGVKTTCIRIQRMLLSRARGSDDEQYFLTLPPSEMITVSTRFARGNEDMRPLSRAAAQQEREEAERTGKARRSVFACGVDGLEPGHRYSVSVAKGKLMSVWWVWGTKDDILVDPESQDWGLDNVQAEEAPLEIEGIESVEFEIEI
ncbi:MAG: hypothetical protein L6R38_009281 [Xanthoria sp. 2 TBL-2021]|nr:MAG: hypothetical protein L6R38_009281 [Xanthoria sp. 2 TBL-2021]